MLKRNSVEKLLRTTFIVALIMAIGLPAFAAKVPASKTKAQQILEAKEAEEQTITEDESVAAPEKVAVENSGRSSRSCSSVNNAFPLNEIVLKL